MGLDKIASILMQVHGIQVAMLDDAFLAKSIEKRMQAIDCDSFDSYCSDLEKNHDEGKALRKCLRIHYSVFFRDPLIFALLERVILPMIMSNKTAGNHKELRIWSAGCAAGQEAYSIAMLLEEKKFGIYQKMKYRIFATDLDEAVLAKARSGVFSASALRNVSLDSAQHSTVGNCYITHLLY